MLPDKLVDAITFVTIAGVFTVVVLNPSLIQKLIALITDTLAAVLKMGK